MPTLETVFRITTITAGVATLLAALSPHVARACTPPEQFFHVFEPSEAWTDVPVEGVLVFDGWQKGYPLGARDSLQIVVRDAAGTEIPGSVEILRVRRNVSPFGGELSVHEKSLLIVWRADESLSPDSAYTAEVSWWDYEENSFMVHFETRTEPFPAPARPMLDAPTAERKRISADGSHTCSPSSEDRPGACPDCTFTDIETVTAIRSKLQPESGPPGGRYVYRELVLEEDIDAINRHATVWGDGGRSDATVYARSSEAGRYCVSIQAVSLIDGATASSETRCAWLGPELTVHTEPIDGAEPIDDTEPMDDAEPMETSDDDKMPSGCSAAGSHLPPFEALLATGVLALLALRRRRSAV